MLAPASIGGLTSLVHPGVDSSSMQAPSSSTHSRTAAVESSPLHPPSSSSYCTPNPIVQFSPTVPSFPRQSANPSPITSTFTPPPTMPKRPQVQTNPRHRRDTPANQLHTPSSVARPSGNPMPTLTPNQASGSKSLAQNTPLSPIRVHIFPHDAFNWRKRSQVSRTMPEYMSSVSYCPTEVLSQYSSPPSPTPSSAPRLSNSRAPKKHRPLLAALPPCPPMPEFHATTNRTKPAGRNTNSAGRNTNSVLESRQEAIEANLAIRATRATYLAYLPKFFELAKIGCIMCWVLGRDYRACPALSTTGRSPTTVYNPYNCSQGLTNPYISRHNVASLGNAGSAYKQNFRNSLAFPSTYKICYNCVRPTDPDAFPHGIRDENCQTHDDVIKPFLWAIYCLPIAFDPPDEGQHWSTLLLQEVGAPRLSTVTDYTNWLRDVPDPDAINLCNGLRLLIAWTSKVYNKSWPSPFDVV